MSRTPGRPGDGREPMKRDVDRLSREELSDSRAAWWNDRFSAFLWGHLEGHVVGRVLDLGCGTGVFFQRMGRYFTPDTALVGVDLDLARLRVAAGESNDRREGETARYLAGDGILLPLKDGGMDLSITILTLQHVERPQAVLAELRRVTKNGGACLCVEPDNAAQRIHLPRPDPEFDAAVSDLWQAVRESYLPRDVSIGPRLPGLLSEAGMRVTEVDGYLIVRHVAEDAGGFEARFSAFVRLIAARYGLEGSGPAERLLHLLAKRRVEYADCDAFYAIHATPLFLVKALKEVS